MEKPPEPTEMCIRDRGFGALGCLYGGRIVNLLAYTLLCALALARCV